MLTLTRWMRVRHEFHKTKTGYVLSLRPTEPYVLVQWSGNKRESKVDARTLELDPTYQEHNDKLLADSNRARVKR